MDTTVQIFNTQFVWRSAISEVLLFNILGLFDSDRVIFPYLELDQ